jgi:hypothetical protein
MGTGTNFGINDDLEYYEYYFDSSDTTVGYSGGTSLNWPLFENGRPLTNVAAVKILEVQIPFSYYVIHSKNNTFILYEQTLNTLTVTLPIGNYTTSTFIPILQTALNTASLNGGLSNTYTVTYSQPTMKYTISSTDPVGFSLGFGDDNDTGNVNPRLWIGFNAGRVYSNGSTLVAPNVQQLTGPNYLYINSYALGPLCQTYLPVGTDNLGNNGGLGPQMCKIPVTVNAGGIIEWQDPDPSKWFPLENLTNFAFVDFYLTMGNNSIPKPLDFNGLSFSLKLGVLTNSMSHSQVQSGLQSQDRIVKRIRPY